MDVVTQLCVNHTPSDASASRIGVLSTVFGGRRSVERQWGVMGPIVHVQEEDVGPCEISILGMLLSSLSFSPLPSLPPLSLLTRRCFAGRRFFVVSRQPSPPPPSSVLFVRGESSNPSRILSFLSVRSRAAPSSPSSPSSQPSSSPAAPGGQRRGRGGDRATSPTSSGSLKWPRRRPRRRSRCRCSGADVGRGSWRISRRGRDCAVASNDRDAGLGPVDVSGTMAFQITVPRHDGSLGVLGP